MLNQKCDDALFKIGAVQPLDWKKMPAMFSEGKLSIAGHPVMEDWEDSYMQELAHIATNNGGVILELGFGLGLSAHHIQQHPIDKHIIVEANEEVFVKLEEFAKNATYRVEPRLGLWEEVIPFIPDNSIDGILYDTYLSNFESEEQCIYEYFPFFEHAYRILKKGGIFTYYSGEVSGFSSQHLQLLQTVGFSDIQKKVCAVNPPDGCLYWKSKTMIAPIVKKLV